MNFLHKLAPTRKLRHPCFNQILWNSTTPSKNVTDVLVSEELDEAKAVREADIERKRNKSRLYPDHYAIYHNENPYTTPVYAYHDSLRYKRRTYGKFGQSSGVDPSVLWPTKEELADILEYDELAHPLSVHEMLDKVKTKKADERSRRLLREKDVAAKVAKIDQWKKDFHDKVRRKSEEVAAAKERKDRLVEEIRQYFGYKIDPRDDRFKEMLAKKEKEAKKLSKTEKQKARDLKLLAEAQVQATAAEDTVVEDEEPVDKSK